MTKKVISTEQFEKDSLSVFERILQGYRKAEQSNVWESDMDSIIENLTLLPTAPFYDSLMKLFDYDYLVLSEDINMIINKAIVIREQISFTQRTVTINETYYSLPFLPKNTHLKRLEVFNNDGELCYLSIGKLHFSIRKLLKALVYKQIPISDAVSSHQKTFQYKELEIFYYSQFIDHSTTNSTDYYDFFCDYYGKIQFVQYFTSKENLATSVNTNEQHHYLADIVKFSSAQQVLWVYFFFASLG